MNPQNQQPNQPKDLTEQNSNPTAIAQNIPYNSQYDQKSLKTIDTAAANPTEMKIRKLFPISITLVFISIITFIFLHIFLNKESLVLWIMIAWSGCCVILCSIWNHKNRGKPARVSMTALTLLFLVAAGLYIFYIVSPQSFFNSNGILEYFSIYILIGWLQIFLAVISFVSVLIAFGGIINRGKKLAIISIFTIIVIAAIAAYVSFVPKIQLNESTDYKNIVVTSDQQNGTSTYLEGTKKAVAYFYPQLEVKQILIDNSSLYYKDEAGLNIVTVLQPKGTTGIAKIYFNEDIGLNDPLAKQLTNDPMLEYKVKKIDNQDWSVLVSKVSVDLAQATFSNYKTADAKIMDLMKQIAKDYPGIVIITMQNSDTIKNEVDISYNTLNAFSKETPEQRSEGFGPKFLSYKFNSVTNSWTATAAWRQDRNL